MPELNPRPSLSAEEQRLYPAGETPPDGDYTHWAPHPWYPGRWTRRTVGPGGEAPNPGQVAQQEWTRQMRERIEADDQAHRAGYANALEREVADLRQQVQQLLRQQRGW